LIVTSEDPAATGSSRLLAAALWYLPRTVPLLPRGKRPRFDDWPDWTASRDTVQAHWQEHPDDNVGVRAGHGLGVVDVDPRAGGEDNLSDLEHEHGELPATVTVLSGGADNGRHLYLRAPDALQTFTLAAGVQVRALAGTGRPQQCVAPPSIHPDTGREYRFAPARAPWETRVAAIPEWMLDGAGQNGTRATRAPEEWVAALSATIPAGERHPTLIALTGHLLSRRVDPFVTLELVRAVNAARCQPPKPDGEIAELVGWVCKREATGDEAQLLAVLREQLP
jgi:hypothetical protein